MLKATFDAQAALGFLVSQVSSIESEVYAIRYADIQYPRLVPVDTSAYPWAKTVTYFTTDPQESPHFSDTRFARGFDGLGRPPR